MLTASEIKGDDRIAPRHAVIRGRETELGVLVNAILGTRLAGPTTVLLEGPAGIGKTRLLAEAERVARRSGFVTIGLTQDLPSLQEALLATDGGPLLLTIDDGQTADPSLLAEFELLLGKYRGRPIARLAAFRDPGKLTGAAAASYRLYAEQSRQRLVLQPLDERAVQAMIADRSRDATQESIAVACIAHGHPGLLTELLDEHFAAGLTPEGVIARRLARLTTRTRTALRCAAMLRPVLLEDELGEITGLRGPTLRECIREGIDAALLVARLHTVSFRDPRIRAAVASTLPSALRPLIARRAVDVTLAHGARPEDAAAVLAEVAEPGDRRALRILRQATFRLRISAPQRAASLGARAIVLDPTAEDDALFASEVVNLLWRAGRSSEARAIARLVTAAGAPDVGASVRLAVERWEAHDLQVVPEANLTPASGGFPYPFSARLAANLALREAVGGIGNTTAEARTHTAVGDDAVAAATTQIALAIREHRHDVRRARLAIDEAGRLSRTPQIADELFSLSFWGCVVLAAEDRFVEGLCLCEQAIERLAQASRRGEARVWRCLRASLLCELGRLSEAGSEAHAFITETSDGMDPSEPLVAWMWLVRARVAMHTGDTRAADAAGSAAGRLKVSATPRSRAIGDLISEIRGDPSSCPGDAPAAAHAFAIPAQSPLIDVMSVRVRNDQGDVTAALAGASALERRASRAQHVKSLRAAAIQARAILSSDPSELAHAAALFASSGLCIGEASCLEDYGRLLHTDLRTAAVTALDKALSLYTAAGATRDAARVCARLRGLGTKRRPSVTVTDVRLGLTPTEERVVEELIAGRSDRDIAENLYVSTHTVRTHVKHILTKLDATSRVEILTKVAAC